MTIPLLELASSYLGPELLEDAVFVGGATLELLTSDPAAPPPRGTDDVDLVVQAATRGEYEAFAVRLRRRGFSEDSTSRVICRWRHSDSELILDVMPTEGRVFGFGNRWYGDVVRLARRHDLPSGAEIRVIDAGVLLATKFEAYADRGRGDYYASRDLADIVTLLDGRPQLVQEVAQLKGPVADYVRERAAWLLDDPDGAAMIEAHMPSLASTPQRIDAVLLPRLTCIAGR